MGGGFGPGTDSGRALGGPGRVRGLGGDVVVGGRTVGCGHSGCDGGGLEAFDDQPDAVAVFSAATRYVQNNAGSLSRWSSESHATDRPSAGAAASHSASSVVLPNPAGADTSVSADSAPRLRRSLSLGRATEPRRHLGTWSLVSSRGPAMTTAPQEPVFTCRQQRIRCQPHSCQPHSCQPHNGWLPHRASRPTETIWSRGSTVRGISADPVGDSPQPAHIDPTARQPIAVKVRCRRA